MNVEKYRFYESAAKRFKAELHLYGATAAIHIENKNDTVFWAKVLQNAFPQGKFRFISASRSYSGAITCGCTQCLQYRDFLDAHFWIAIDSDYRYLSREPDIDAHHYILQTYTYSFENHFCFWRNAQRVTGDPLLFDWRQFLTDYSRIVYPLLVWQLYLEEVDAEAFPKAVFHRLLTVPFGARSIERNGDPVLLILKQRTRKLLTHLRNVYPEADLEPIKARCSLLGLHPDNAYLYVRGHQLYDMMIAMGRKLRSRLLHDSELHDSEETPGFEAQLLEQLPFDQYDEIRKVIEDVYVALGLL